MSFALFLGGIAVLFGQPGGTFSLLRSGAGLAAGLSGGSPMKTGWQSVRLALAGFIVPFMFVYNPQLLLENVTLLSGLQVVVTACIGVVLALVTVGWLIIRKIIKIEV